MEQNDRAVDTRKIRATLCGAITYLNDVNSGGHYYYFDCLESEDKINIEKSDLEKILPPELMNNFIAALKAYIKLKETGDESAKTTLEQCDYIFYENEHLINDVLEEYAYKIEM